MEKVPLKLFYITKNGEWGGSEKLWYESVQAFVNKGVSVSLAVGYDNKKVEELKSQLPFFVNLRKRYSTLSKTMRIVNKVTTVFKRQDLLLKALESFKPGLVVISQGNHNSSVDVMELCIKYNFKYVVVSHIVTEMNWFWLDESMRHRLVSGFEKAVKAYFVSEANIILHEFLLVYKANNAEIVRNPYAVHSPVPVTYPCTLAGYNVAVVGRIECYHKGLDILLHVLSNNKWKQRPVTFNLYGSGPHSAIIKQLLTLLGISNVFLKGFSSDVITIWNENHALISPSRMEGHSIALLEALSLNRTAIVTKVGGASEVIEDNITGFIADVPTIEGVDEALERAWQRRSEWEELGIRAGNHLKKIMPADPVLDFNKKIVNIAEGIDNKVTAAYPLS